MGNCATKPKTKDDDDAPPPAELQTPVAEEERKDEKVAAPEGSRQWRLARPSQRQKLRCANSSSLISRLSLAAAGLLCGIPT
jgi:hypothetical protein